MKRSLFTPLLSALLMLIFFASRPPSLNAQTFVEGKNPTGASPTGNPVYIGALGSDGKIHALNLDSSGNLILGGTGSTVLSGGTLTGSLPAGEYHLGEVGGNSVQITPALSVSTSAYSAKQVVGGVLTLSSAMRVSGGSAILQSLLLIENSTTLQNQPMELLLFDTPTLTGTYTDRTALALNASDISHLIRRVSIAASDYVTLSGTTVSIADISPGSRVVRASGTNALGALLITTGTPTYSATNSLTLRAGFLRD